MKVAIGTLRTPKIEGVKEGFSTCPYFKDEFDSIEFITFNASSNISHTPLSIDEVMLGARNRVQSMKNAGVIADYYIGIEGGASKFGDHSYLFGVVYIENDSGVGHYGISPMVEIPRAIEHKLYEEKEELGTVMGTLSGQTDIRSENGSMGAWTEDMITRKDEFVVAFRTAIAPFFNSYYRL